MPRKSIRDVALGKESVDEVEVQHRDQEMLLVARNRHATMTAAHTCRWSVKSKRLSVICPNVDIKLHDYSRLWMD
jgi:hypothetical protein